MGKLQIVKSDKFGEVACDVYSNNNDEYFMTIDQLSQVLGYADTSGVRQIMSRNEYLRDKEFSTRDNLSQVEGDRDVSRERILFTEDGIYEVTMLSQTENGRNFRRWLRTVIKSIRKTGKYELPNQLTRVDTIATNVRALSWHETPTNRKQRVNEELSKLRQYYYDLIDQDAASEPEPMGIFLQDCCTVDQDSIVERTPLYNSYVRWSCRNNVYPKTKAKLTKFLDDREDIAYLKPDSKQLLNARFMGIELNAEGLRIYNE